MSSTSRGERPIFSGRFTVALAGFLAVPFAVKSLVWAEPWPSIMFPSGASKVDVQDRTVVFSVVTAEVLRGSQARPITAEELIKPVPPHYLELIFRSRLGQDDRPYRELVMKRGGKIWHVPRVPPTAQEQDAARRWLAERVMLAGLAGDSVSVRSDTITVETGSGKELARARGDEVLVSLR